MAQMMKIDLQTQIESSPDRMFDIYKNKSNLLPKICPHRVQTIKVLEGDGRTVGSVRLWTYVLGGPVIAKDKIDVIDEKNHSITFELIGGEVTKHFKSFTATIQLTANPDMNLVKWSLEFEKANEEVPTPYSHLDFLVSMSKEVDAYLLNA